MIYLALKSVPMQIVKKEHGGLLENKGGGYMERMDLDNG